LMVTGHGAGQMRPVKSGKLFAGMGQLPEISTKRTRDAMGVR
jgi:hypothetical protein